MREYRVHMRQPDGSENTILVRAPNSRLASAIASALDPDARAEIDAMHKELDTRTDPAPGIRLTPWAFGERRPPAGPSGTD